jgi:hypothetical protein
MRAHDMCRWPRGVLGVRLLLLLMPMATGGGMGGGGMGGGGMGGGGTGGGGMGGGGMGTPREESDGSESGGSDMGGGETGGGEMGGSGGGEDQPPLSFLGGIATNFAAAEADGGGHKRQRKQEQPTTNFLGGIAANAMAQPKTKLPEFMIEDTALHKRRRGSRGCHVLEQKVAYIERAISFKRSGRSDFLAAAVQHVQDPAARKRLHSCLKNWMGHAPVLLHEAYAHSELSRMTAALKMPCKGEHADAEEIVVSMFNARRQRGEMVTAEWLASTMRKQCCDPSFVASYGWFRRFAARHKLVPRRRKNSKNKSLEERMPAIAAWHRNLRTQVIPASPRSVARRLLENNLELSLAIIMEECINDVAVPRLVLHKEVRLVLGLDQLPPGSRTLLNKMQTRLQKHEDALVSGPTDWKDERSLVELSWGRFPPDRVYNVDQVPLPFVVGTDTTWDDKGAERVWVRQYGSGLDKRQATMQLTICAGDGKIR